MTTDLEAAASAAALKEAGVKIEGLSAREREAVQTIISDSLFNGWSSTKTATRLKQVVGLSTRQQAAVTKYRAAQVAAGRTPKQADAAATKYAERLRKARAALIADYEVRKATADAKRAEWAAQRQSGQVSNRAVRVFRVHKDERTCPVCRKLNGRRHSLTNSVNAPPLHPNCRCTEELVDEGIVKSSLVYDEKEILAKATARDGDGDGMIYDGTPMERPAVAAHFDLPDDLGITWHERRGALYGSTVKYGELDKEAHDAVAKVFTFTDEKTGFHTKVQATEVFGSPDGLHRPGVNVHGVILNATGHEVGRFERVLTTPQQDKGGQWEAHHEELVLFPSFQGQGFDSRWNAHLFNLYRDGNFSNVYVYANIDVGGYAQATKGFDWAQPTEKVIWGLRSLVENQERLETPDWLVRQAEDILKRHAAGEHITAWEVANLGRKEWEAGDHWEPKFIRGFNGDLSFTSGKWGLSTRGRQAIRGSNSYDSDTWATNNHVGKAILLGDRWHGVLDLKDPPKPVKKSAPALTGYDLAMAHHQWVEEIYAQRRGRTFNPPPPGVRSCYTNHHLDVEATDADMALLDSIIAGYQQVEKTKHVRTPEGVKRYKLPIGSPIPERPKILPPRHRRHRLSSEVADANPVDPLLFRRFTEGDSSMDFETIPTRSGVYDINNKARGHTKAMLAKKLRDRIKKDNPEWKSEILRVDTKTFAEATDTRRVRIHDDPLELRGIYNSEVGIDQNATEDVYKEIARKRYDKQIKFLAEDRDVLIKAGVLGDPNETRDIGNRYDVARVDLARADRLIATPFKEDDPYPRMYEMSSVVGEIQRQLQMILNDERSTAPLTFDQVWVLQNRHTTSGLMIGPSAMPADQQISYDPLPDNISPDDLLAETRLAIFVRESIDSWANTSSDHDTRALTAQLAVSNWANERLGLTIGDRSWMAGPERNEPYRIAQDRLAPENYTQPVYNMMFSAMYDETQELLKSKGIDSVKLQRGIGFEKQSAPDWLKTALHSRSEDLDNLRFKWINAREARREKIASGYRDKLAKQIAYAKETMGGYPIELNNEIDRLRRTNRADMLDALEQSDIRDEIRNIQQHDPTIPNAEAYETAVNRVKFDYNNWSKGNYLDNRGISDPAGIKVEGRATMNPITSWGVHPETAAIFQGYTDYPIRITANIPRENVLSTAVTGFGALIENEFVLLGMPLDEFWVTDSRTIEKL